MGEIEIQQIQYGSYGKCISVTNGDMEFVATLEIGPRIIKFGKKDGPNMFCEDINDNLFDDKNLKGDFYKGKGYWHCYGGHRFWTSPEVHPRTYYPDNRPVSYEVLENGVALTQEAQVENNVQLKMVATMDKDGIVTVNHYITNIGVWNIKLAPWSISVMNVGGMEVIPQTKRKTGYLHNRTISLWDYTNMNDKRVEWLKDYVVLNTTKDTDGPFKLGISNDDGFACYFDKGNLFIKRFDKFDGETEYPDNNVNYETYTCEFMTELETIGKFYNIKPGETISHTEKWQLIPNVEKPQSVEEIDEVIKKFV